MGPEESTVVSLMSTPRIWTRKGAQLRVIPSRALLAALVGPAVPLYDTQPTLANNNTHAIPIPRLSVFDQFTPLYLDINTLKGAAITESIGT